MKRYTAQLQNFDVPSLLIERKIDEETDMRTNSKSDGRVKR